MWKPYAVGCALFAMCGGALADQSVARSADGSTSLAASVVLAAEEVKPVRWEGSFTLGLGLFHSSVNSSNFNVFTEVHRISPLDRISVDAGYVLAKLSSTTSAEQFFMDGDYNHVIGKRLFYYVDGKLKKDRIQHLDLRYLIGAGLGYLIVDSPTTHFRVKAGVAFLSEAFAGDETRTNATGEFGYAFDTELRKGLRFTHDFSLYPHLSDLGDNYWVTTFGLSQSLGGSWTVDIKYIQDYNSRVAPGATRSSNSLLIGIGKKF